MNGPSRRLYYVPVLLNDGRCRDDAAERHRAPDNAMP
jgi:hypothetical protein